MITGAFHTTNSSNQLNEKKEFGRNQYYRRKFLFGNKRDGFTSLIEDPENTMNTVATLQVGETYTPPNVVTNFRTMIFSFWRRLDLVNWILELEEPGKEHTVHVVASSAPALLYAVVSSPGSPLYLHIFTINLKSGETISEAKGYEV